MPNFIRKTLIFGVVIPEEVSERQEVLSLKKLYKRNYGLSAGITAILVNVVGIYFDNIHVSNFGILLMIVVMTINYLYIHKKAKALKEEKGWTVNKKQLVVVDTSHTYNNRLPSLHWFWLPICILIFTLILTIIQYPYLPEKIPTHFDFLGNITDYSDKNFFNVFILPLTQLAMIVMFYFIYRILRSAKTNINAARPRTSSLQNQIAKRYWAIYLLGFLVLINLQFLYLQLYVLQVIHYVGGWNIIINMVTLLFSLLGAIVVSIMTGQSGSRVKISIKEEVDSTVIDRDDDIFWKWGMLYYNPDDPSVFIEKRFGIGWTINYGHPWGKIIMAMLIIIIVASLLMPIFLGR